MGGAAPKATRQTVHTHIANIRLRLEQATTVGEDPVRLIGCSGEYVLYIDPNQTTDRLVGEQLNALLTASWQGVYSLSASSSGRGVVAGRRWRLGCGR